MGFLNWWLEFRGVRMRKWGRREHPVRQHPASFVPHKQPRRAPLPPSLIRQYGGYVKPLECRPVVVKRPLSFFSLRSSRSADSRRVLARRKGAAPDSRRKCRMSGASVDGCYSSSRLPKSNFCTLPYNVARGKPNSLAACATLPCVRSSASCTRHRSSCSTSRS